MKKVLGTIFFVIYAIIAIAVTVLLLSYNDYNCSELGNYTLYIVKDDSLEPNYKKGDLLIIDRNNLKNVELGDSIFLYNVISSSEYSLVVDKVEGKIQQGDTVLLSTEKNGVYSSVYYIGKENSAKAISNLGTILSILESKWGYLCCIVIVSLILLLEEIFELVIEIKYSKYETAKEK